MPGVILTYNIQHTDNATAALHNSVLADGWDGSTVQRSGRRCGVLRLTREGTNVGANSMRSASLQIAGGGAAVFQGGRDGAVCEHELAQRGRGGYDDEVGSA